ncbi:hypothetical protein SARC_15910 [Sphaeroforma arctica JP610]|uniref:Uncharacterized protein n=1 Tax=Sphaeroforma arctica JP610 TaxID=667725 RepID=A0A0L0F4J0_9EUKA|nr:hypothetical protein SARC_15910 [Sphaeroforma arctica JP610]KNC71549.1 hypothetical protein SARC_15910 [Sphaeroforma arctica JP610]|eukprot:XP_014145451.1 hypothetical protein SARC_15910 [Sphaeroforma arctica JP610]
MAFVKKLIRKGKHKENGAAVEALSKPTSLTLSTAIESSKSVPVISVPKAESDACPSKKQSSGVSRKIQSNLELLGEHKSEKTDTSSQSTLKDSNLQTSSEQLEAATTAKSSETKPVPQPTDSAISNSKAEKNDAPPKLPPRDPKLQANM